MVDLDGDERSDLVVGFDRAISETAEFAFEIGARSFMQQADGTFVVGRDHAGRFSFGGSVNGHAYPGYRGSTVLVNADNQDSFEVGDQTSFDGTPPTRLTLPELTEEIFELLSLPTPDGHAHLLATGRKNFYVLDLGQTPPVLVTNEPLAFEGGSSHELGGGPESPRYFVYDYDHDGDADFFERDQGSLLGVHINTGDSRFAALQAVPVSVGGSAEKPLLVAGPVTGIVAQSNDHDSVSVYTLVGASAAPP